MTRKILVCLDGSRMAEQILPYAVDEAKCSRSELVLLQVVTAPHFIVAPGIPGVPGGPVPYPESPKQILKEDSEAQAYLDSVANILREKGLKIETVVLPGAVVGEAIIDYAQDNKINVIAIATHGRGGLSRLVMGSVADYILKNSGIPIFTISPKRESK